MSYLVRKVEAAKWRQNPITEGAEVSADAITNCMKTKRNSISVWEIAEEASINEAILAIVSASDHIDTIDVALLPLQSVIDAGITLQSTPGITPVPELVNSHRDISELNYHSLGIIKDIIVDQFKMDRVTRYTKKQLKTLILEAVDSNRLDRTLLKADVRKEI